MKKIFVILCCIAIVSCAKEDGPIESPLSEIEKFPVQFLVEGEDFTKTLLDADKNIQWSTGNTCALMYRDGQEFQSDKLTYDFDSKSLKGEIGNTQDIYYAAYPRLVDGVQGEQVRLFWDSAKSLRYYKQTIVNSQQIERAGTFANGACFSVAYTDNTTLNFKNLCAIFKVSILDGMKNSQGESISISQIDMSPIKNDESFRATYKVYCPTSVPMEPSYEITQESQDERYVSIKKTSGNFGSGDYYLCAPAIASSYGLKVDIHFDDNTIHSVYAYGNKTYSRNTIYNLGTVKYGAEKSILVTDQLAEKPSWITNADHVSIADTPSKDMKNQNAKALKVSKLGSEGTTGYFKITYCGNATNPAGTVDHSECKKYNGMRLKLYCEKANDVYFFAEFGGSSKRLPSRVNGTLISNADEYNAQIKADAWNILEYDLKDFDPSKPTANYYQSFGMRPFCNSEGGNSTVSNRIAYIDDIELIWK